MGYKIRRVHSGGYTQNSKTLLEVDGRLVKPEYVGAIWGPKAWCDGYVRFSRLYNVARIKGELWIVDGKVTKRLFMVEGQELKPFEWNLGKCFVDNYRKEETDETQNG